MLQIDTNEQLSLDTRDFVGKSTAVLGITGSGKTNTAAVLIEELLASGLPLTIVDIEGEYYGLKERYELLVAGRSEHAELEIGPENAAQLAEVSIQRGISVILDLSEYTQEEQYAFLIAYFTRLWEVAGRERKPYQVVLEEAHEWIPQSVRTPLKTILTRIALRGRKRGLGIILMSQRSAKVEKDVLTQTALLFLHKVVHPTDMRVYTDLIPLPTKEVESLVGNLAPGQVVMISNHVPQIATIRLRHTFHAGATPEFGMIAEPELRKIDATMLQELQAALKAEKHGSSNVEARQARRIAELEALLRERDAEIARLREENALLSKLTVSMEGMPSALPTSLEISKATVQQMHVANGHMEPVQVVESLPVAHNTVQVLDAPPLNERKFAAFIKRLEQFSSLHLQILRLLTEQGKALSYLEIAAWLNRSENWVRNNPPYGLLTMKLLTRERYSSGGYYYRSLVREYLQKEFPGVDVNTLITRMFS